MLSLLCNRDWEAGWRECGGIWCCWPPRSSLSIGIEHAIARCMMITMMQMYQYKWKGNFIILCIWSMYGSYLRVWLLVIGILAGCFLISGKCTHCHKNSDGFWRLDCTQECLYTAKAEIRWISFNCVDGTIPPIKLNYYYQEATDYWQHLRWICIPVLFLRAMF